MVGLLVGEPAAEPVADRERDQDDADRVRPDDRRGAEVRRHQPRDGDLGAERAGADDEDEEVEVAVPGQAPPPACGRPDAGLDPVAQPLPLPGADRPLGPLRVELVRRAPSARSISSWRSVSCRAQRRTSQVRTVRVITVLSAIITTPAVPWSARPEIPWASLAGRVARVEHVPDHIRTFAEHGADQADRGDEIRRSRHRRTSSASAADRAATSRRRTRR